MHSSSLSESSLPHSLLSASSGSGLHRHPPSIDVTPWIVYEHVAPDVGGPSDKKSVRVVGRGGLGSRPQRSRALSVDDMLSTADRLPHHDEVDQVLERSPSDPQSRIRIVGRGGFGSKRRKAASDAVQAAVKTSDASPASPSSPIASKESFGTKVVRMNGRGGAGSKPRIIEPKPRKDKGKRIKWIEKGKAKLLPSKLPTLPAPAPPPPPPPAESESDDDGSVRFAPIPQPPTKHQPSVSETPSLVSTSDSCPPGTPVSASISGASDLDSSLRTNDSRLYKLYRTLGEPYPNDVPLMSIVHPVRSPTFGIASCDEHSLNPEPSDTTSTQSYRKSESFSIQSPASRRGSSFVEVYMDDEYESASILSVTTPLPAMTFFEPPVKPIQPSTSNLPEENEDTYIYSEDNGGERPDTPFSQYPLLPGSPHRPHVIHSAEREPGEGWSGTWNSDMQHVINRLRLLH